MDHAVQSDGNVTEKSEGIAQLKEENMEEEATLYKVDTVVSPTPNTKDEVFARVFSPIKNESSLIHPDLPLFENDDSSNRKLSREDLETMEIMSKVENEPKGTESEISESAESEVIKYEKNSSVSTPLSTRITDPILKQNNIFSALNASDLVEYQWPPGENGDYYMLQEQVSTFLGITSFKRKYPEIERRKLDPQEIKYLMTKMMVNDVQVTLGLTAVKSHDVADLMIKEYPEKYQEYTQVLDEKQKQSIKNKHMQYCTPAVEKSQLPNYIKKAMKQVSTYNTRLNRQRKDDFAVYYDMQTNVLHYPESKHKKADPEVTKPSLYPCTLIPGQFQEYFQKYSADELFYLPLNTAVYGPPAPIPDKLEDISTSGSEAESEHESIETASADAKSERSQESTKLHTTDDHIQAPPTPETDLLEVKEESNQGADDSKFEESKDGGLDANDSMKDLDNSLLDLEDPEKPICGICLKDESCNKKGEYEDLISCSQCDNYGHPSCLDMSKDLVSVIVTYNWQCLECKTCTYCSKPHHEDKMMFCDRCDRGYHTFCVGLRNLPSGLWMCPNCTRSDPDFAKRGGRRGGPRKRKIGPATPASSDQPPKPKRKRRTKKEMEEARERERIEKEEKLKRHAEKKMMKKARRKERREAAEKNEEDVKKEEEDEPEVEEEEGETTKEENNEMMKDTIVIIESQEKENKNEDDLQGSKMD